MGRKVVWLYSSEIALLKFRGLMNGMRLMLALLLALGPGLLVVGGSPRSLVSIGQPHEARGCVREM